MTTSAPQKAKSDKAITSFQTTGEFRDRVEACRRQEGERSISKMLLILIEESLQRRAIY